MEYAQLSSAKSSLEQQVAELQERLQERENEVAKQTERTKELEEALSDVQTDSKRAATEQISAKSAGDSQVLVLNSRLKVLQASLEEKQ